MKTFKTVIVVFLALFVAALFAGCSNGNGVSLDTSLNSTPLFDESLLTVTLETEEIADGTWTFKCVDINKPYSTSLSYQGQIVKYTCISSEYVIVQRISKSGENATVISGSDKHTLTFDEENKTKYKDFKETNNLNDGETWNGNTATLTQNDYKFASFLNYALRIAAEGDCTILTNEDRTLYKISEKDGPGLYYFAK